MKQSILFTQSTHEELFDNEIKGSDFSSGNLSLLTANLVTLRAEHEMPLNEIELKAVYGMISYVAYDQNSEEDVVGKIMTSHFGVGSVATLPSCLYQNAIEYLMDL